jgi:hypothetical protein
MNPAASANMTQPTPYAGVNAVLGLLLSNVKHLLGNDFVGMYLYGSLASGDFDPEGSDIDFAVVTAAELPDQMVPALKAMHAGIAASGLKWAPKLEGWYIPQKALWRYDPAAAPCVAINEGHFYLVRQASDWVIQRHILREQGVVLAGPPLQSMIDPV